MVPQNSVPATPFAREHALREKFLRQVALLRRVQPPLCRFDTGSGGFLYWALWLLPQVQPRSDPVTGPSKTDRCGAARQRWRRAAVSLTLMLAAAALPAHAFPADAQAENHLANASRLIRDGDLREAEAELRRAVDLVADNPTYLARLGQVLGMQNRMEEAARYYRRALKLAPDSLAIRRNLALTQWVPAPVYRSQGQPGAGAGQSARRRSHPVAAGNDSGEFRRIRPGGESTGVGAGAGARARAMRWPPWPGPNTAWAKGNRPGPLWSPWRSTGH